MWQDPETLHKSRTACSSDDCLGLATECDGGCADRIQEERRTDPSQQEPVVSCVYVFGACYPCLSAAVLLDNGILEWCSTVELLNLQTPHLIISSLCTVSLLRLT